MAKPVQPVTFDGKKFKRGDKVITRANRQYKVCVVRWVSGQLAQGKSLETVLPVETNEALPNILDFMKMVNNSDETKQIYNEARLARYTLMSERLVSAVQKHERAGTKESADTLKAIAEARKYLQSGGVDQDNITIEVTSNVPAGFWNKSDYAVNKGGKDADKQD